MEHELARRVHDGRPANEFYEHYDCKGAMRQWSVNASGYPKNFAIDGIDNLASSVRMTGERMNQLQATLVRRALTEPTLFKRPLLVLQIETCCDALMKFSKGLSTIRAFFLAMNCVPCLSKESVEFLRSASKLFVTRFHANAAIGHAQTRWGHCLELPTSSIDSSSSCSLSSAKADTRKWSRSHITWWSLRRWIKRRACLAKQRGESVINFTVGDYVLRSRVDQKHLNKLLVTWTGPYVVTRAVRNAFVIKNLVTSKEATVHGSRLKFYADKDLNVTEELLQHIGSQGVILDVRAFKEHQWNQRKKNFVLKTSWVGLEDMEDSWELLAQMAKDVPELVDAYVESTDDTCLKQLHTTRKKRKKDGD